MLRRRQGQVAMGMGAMTDRAATALGTPHFEAKSIGAFAIVAVVLAAIGIGPLLGLAGTLTLSRVLASFLFGVRPYDPLTLGGMAVVLLLVSLTACLVPARRATSVDPVRVLQAE